MVGRILVVGAVIAAVAVPSVAGAKPGHGPAQRAAVKACLKERREDGRQAFVASYGRPAFKRCVRQLLPEARNAAQECRQEREDSEAFAAQYGSARNAFGKCVSSKVSGKGEEGKPAECPSGEVPADNGSECPGEEPAECPAEEGGEVIEDNGAECPAEEPGELPEESVV